MLAVHLGLASRPGGEPFLVGRLTLVLGGLQASLALLQALAAALAGAQPVGQLVAATLAQALVLFGVQGCGLFEDALDLFAYLLVGAVRPMRGVGLDLGAVEGEQADRDEPRFGAEPQDLGEGLGQGALVTGAKAGDSRVVWDLVGADHPEGHVLAAATLDSARGALANAVAVEQKADHRLGLEGGGAPAVFAVLGVERGQVDLLDRVDHEPGEVVLGQPLGQAGRQKQLLVSVAGEEVVGHRAPPIRSLGAIVEGAADGAVHGVCAGEGDRLSLATLRRAAWGVYATASHHLLFVLTRPGA